MSETTVSTVSAEDAAVAAFKAKVIDGAVRASRTNRWCSSFETAMQMIFPEGSDQPNGEWYDSDGFTCRGFDKDGYNQQGRDRDGYDRDGYNHDGYNRQGYGRDGYNRAGYNADGLNAAGVRFDDPTNPYRFDRSGYDVNGWHHTQDYNLNGSSRADRQRACVYDVDGYDARGLNYYGERRRDS